MLGTFAFPALIPSFAASWGLSNTQAGWISGVYFAAYAVSVPLLVTLTDRTDARRVWLAGAALTGLSALGFALVAQGFWTALLLRALAGIGLAGTYMPGLRALVDRYEGANQPRAIAFYTASFSLGSATSYLVAGEVAGAFGWRWAFGAAALAALVALALVAALRPVRPEPTPDDRHLLDFRPVLRNRPAMGYILGYAAHCWELFGMRAWIVAFLAFSLTLAPMQGGWSPTTIATLGALVAMAASIIGGDLATRFGRRRVIALAMAASGACSAGIGFLAGSPYAAVAVFSLVYAAAIQLDSAALTTGAVEAASAGLRGATLALHSLLGFGAAFLGPVAVGAVLDVAGGRASVTAWGLAFASLAVVGLLGPLALLLGARGDGADAVSTPHRGEGSKGDRARA